MATTRICNPADEIERLRPLLLQNWAETGQGFAFAPDVEAYDLAFGLGLVFGVVLEDEAGAPIGYCSVTVAPHSHNPAVVFAANDALYVAPSYRHTAAAARLIAAAEAEASTRGAHCFTWHCVPGTPLAKTLMRHGYAPCDVVVKKDLQ